MGLRCSTATLMPSGQLILKFPEPVPKDKSAQAKWLINGFPATVTTWTLEQWAALDKQPNDAQQVGCVWVSIRVD